MDNPKVGQKVKCDYETIKNGTITLVAKYGDIKENKVKELNDEIVNAIINAVNKAEQTDNVVVDIDTEMIFIVGNDGNMGVFFGEMIKQNVHLIEGE